VIPGEEIGKREFYRSVRSNRVGNGTRFSKCRLEGLTAKEEQSEGATTMETAGKILEVSKSVFGGWRHVQTSGRAVRDFFGGEKEGPDST